MKQLAVILALLLALLGTGCGAGDATTPSVAPPPSQGDTAAPGIILTDELITEIEDALLERTPDAFVAKHPDFLWGKLSEVSFDGTQDTAEKESLVRLSLSEEQLAREELSAEEVLANHSRLAKFYENCAAGTPDSIALLYSGSPVPLWIAIYSFDGKETTRRMYQGGIGYRCGTDGDNSAFFQTQEYSVVVNQGFGEAPAEWILTSESKLEIRYPKYGFAPRQITPDTLEATLLEGSEEGSSLSQTGDTVTLGGKMCTVYQVLNRDKVYLGDSFAVAEDFSRYYQVEQVNGSWLLCARAKSQE